MRRRGDTSNSKRSPCGEKESDPGRPPRPTKAIRSVQYSPYYWATTQLQWLLVFIMEQVPQSMIRHTGGEVPGVTVRTAPTPSEPNTPVMAGGQPIVAAAQPQPPLDEETVPSSSAPEQHADSPLGPAAVPQQAQQQQQHQEQQAAAPETVVEETIGDLDNGNDGATPSNYSDQQEKAQEEVKDKSDLLMF